MNWRRDAVNPHDSVCEMLSVRGRHGGQCDGPQQQGSAQGRNAGAQASLAGAANSRAQQNEAKRSKGRRADSRARYHSSHIYRFIMNTNNMIMSDCSIIYSR